VAIPYPVGNPNETEEKEREIREKIVREALMSLVREY
jgi:hypothetical protein